MAIRGHTNIDAMRDESPSSVMNNFVAGLKTEFTGMNFPLNAATDCDNVIYTMQGDVTRRPGFDFETHYTLNDLSDRTGAVVNTYIWRNAGGDGESMLYVSQIGTFLYFFNITAATVLSPLSTQKLVSVVDISQYAVAGPDRSADCQFADGNGYLFGYCNACDPFYCTYDPVAHTVTSGKIDVKTRDFTGLPEHNAETTDRPLTLTQEHEYNLRNQGWTRAPLWSVNAIDTYSSLTTNIQDSIPLSFTGNGATGAAPFLGNHTWNILPGEPITVGTPVDMTYSTTANVYDITAVSWNIGGVSGSAKGIVISYNSTTGQLVVDVTSVEPQLLGSQYEISFASDPGGDLNGFVVGYSAPVSYTIKSSDSINTIDTWHRLIGNYPSNADIWWIFKNANDEFDPATTIGNKGLPSAWAPKGHFITSAFDIDRVAAVNAVSPYGNTGITSITNITTSKRPRTGTWFQGRVWYTGVDDSQQASADIDYTTWTENIYFSQIVEGIADFGHCYEANDPTDQYSFNLLPTDGGVITIQGCGAIYKLFPIQNGMLVFAANGIWFITGSQGIGFSASDYTITKISAVRSISSNSYVDVNGLPIFWNEEGIYTVSPAQQGLGLTVNPLTLGTIKSFYNQIPLDAKKQARGSYNPIDYVAQWTYQDHATISAEINTISTPAGKGDYTIHIFDDCCHLFTSTDTGSSWNEYITPVGTEGDDWTDMSMALNDRDYTTLGFWAEFVNGGPFAFSSRGAFEKIYAPNQLRTGPLIDYTVGKGSLASGAYMEADSGAMSKDGKIILACPRYYLGLTEDAYPRISRDGGLTWSDVNGIPPNQIYERACFSQGAEIMYLVLHKSTGTTHEGYASYDQGNSWFKLPNFPSLADNAGSSQSSLRLLCNINGSTVAMADWQGNFHVSHDFGITWTTTDMRTPAGVSLSYASYAGEFSMSLDGTVMIYSLGNNVSSPTRRAYILVSTDSGVTWTLKTTPNQKDAVYGCAVAPDGLGMFVCYANQNQSFGNNGFLTVDLSTDGGLTWTQTATFECLANVEGSVGAGSSGNYVAYYMLPPETWDGTTTGSLSTQSTTNQYQFNRILNLNTATGAFYPWTASSEYVNGAEPPRIHSVDYVAEPGGLNGIPAKFRYFTSLYDNTTQTYSYTFSECSDLNYLDWNYNNGGSNYDSYFITGFALDGQGLRKFQPNYVNMFCRDPASVYTIQGIWDFAINGASGQWTSKQKASFASNLTGNYSMVHKRHKIRGHGYTFQYKIASVDNNPFDIMGWSSWITENAGI